jgi:hypothetical protein
MRIIAVSKTALEGVHDGKAAGGQHRRGKRHRARAKK